MATRTQVVAAGVAVLLLTACSSTPPTPTASESSAASAPAELPPKPQVLFTWYMNGSDRKSIVVTDADLSMPAVELIPNSEHTQSEHPRWSHDGKRIAYQVTDYADGDQVSVWVADASGKNATLVAACEADPCLEISYPAWSPDDSKLVTVQLDTGQTEQWGSSHLVLIDVATGEREVLASTADGLASYLSPEWSPDGSQIAVTVGIYPDASSEEVSVQNVTVFDADPAKKDPGTAVTPPELMGGFPSWHPTDGRIVFATWDIGWFKGTEPSQLYTVRADGSELTQVTHIADPNEGRPAMASWTPDGERIVGHMSVMEDSHVSNVMLTSFNPETGDFERSDIAGAQPYLQPLPAR